MTSPAQLETSLGPPLRRADAHWTIDLTDLPLFHGLSVLSRALGEQVVEHCLTERFDLDVERRTKASENPELVALGCASVRLLAERDVVAHVPDDVEGFQHHLRAVFGTLQRAHWRTLMFPPDPATPPRALVFTFPVRDDFDFRFVLDRVPFGGRDRRFVLRIAVENPRGRRLDLASVPHAVVDDLGAREYIAGSTRIAQTLRDLVQRETDRGRTSHLERRKSGAFLFAQLEKAGLGHLQSLHLAWSERFGSWLASAGSTPLDNVLKRVLLLLEDSTVRATLREAQTIQLTDGDVAVFLDFSQQHRVLNIAFDQPRKRVRIDNYLARMPALAAAAQSNGARPPLAGLSVLLIHHITAEVLGLIAALRVLGCTDLTVLFVRYAGEVPNEYLDAVLDLEPAVLCYALQQRQTEEELEGHFVLSRQFSPLDPLARVAERLRSTRTRYLDAMQAVAAQLLLDGAGRAARAKGRMLVIEDGGYLMPLVTQAAADEHTVSTFATAQQVSVPSSLSGGMNLDALLQAHVVGSVEHTRNGFDQLEAVEQRLGALARPAYSIAISRLKIEEEAQEVAAGVLAAIEAVYHASGLVLSRRHPLVLGSRGAIGAQLMLALTAGARVGTNEVLGIDRRVERATRTEASRWSGLPASRRRGVDLVIGVTGMSVLSAAEIEELVLHGTAPIITFASGSTKTVEFRDVAAWVERLLSADKPRIGRQAVEISPEAMLDPQSGRVYGSAFRLRLGRGRNAIDKRLLFIANLTPVNFLFYGVPTEVMDRVMAQLLRTSLALVRDEKAGKAAPRLYAVDRDFPARRL